MAAADAALLAASFPIPLAAATPPLTAKPTPGTTKLAAKAPVPALRLSLFISSLVIGLAADLLAFFTKDKSDALGFIPTDLAVAIARRA